jgi:hypothetical protein
VRVCASGRVFSSGKILLETNEMALLDLSKSRGTNLHLLNVVPYNAHRKSIGLRRGEKSRERLP